MLQMIMLASFNSTTPSTGEVITASCVGLAILVFIVFTRAAECGSLVGGISGGGIAFFVFEGNSASHGGLFMFLFLGVVGLFAGGIAGMLGSQLAEERADKKRSKLEARANRRRR
jgi:hypothetical protein